MKSKFIAIAAFFILASLNVQAQESVSPPFQIRLPQTIDTTNLSILYSLTGAFGGYYGFIRTKTGIRDYEIDTTYKNKAAEALKVIVYCPGYQVETPDFKSLADLKEWKAELQLKPLATVPFSGRILLPDTLSSDEIRVDISHSPFWECEFFELMDCLVSSFKITSVELSAGGKFRVALPDFAHDHIVSSYSNPGDFTFAAFDRKSGKFLFSLKTKENSKEQGRIRIANWYPDEQVFSPEVER